MRIVKRLMIFSLLSLVGYVQAQERQQTMNLRQSSVLSGRVFDRNGAVIAGATVRFSGNKKAAIEVQTDAEGIYHAELQPGFYDIEITESGFYKFNFDCYQIPPQTRLSLDVTLTVGGEGACMSSHGSEKGRSKGKRDKRLTTE